MPDRIPAVADKDWTPTPLPIDDLLRHDAILVHAARLAHAGIRVVLPPVRRTR
jgi:hypothetical protein